MTEMACFRGNREEFYGEVLLLDDSKVTLTAQQGVKKSSKAGAVLQQVFSHLNLVDVHFFGLRFCDDKHQTHWLDPVKTLSRHRGLMGPPYIFYFGVRFYAENPSKLKEETTRLQFYLQLRQDVCRGRLPCPAHLRPRLSALMLQADHGDLSGAEASGENQEVQAIYKSLRGVSRPQARNLLISLCCSLSMYGVSLFNAYGESQSEYFLGPTPVGVVIYKNKVLVGKYLWPRITKLHFKNKTFELRVIGKKGSETSFFFHTSDNSDCKRLWRCCVEHHVFFRMSESNHSMNTLRNNFMKNQTSTTTMDHDIRPEFHSNHTLQSIHSEPEITQTQPCTVLTHSHIRTQSVSNCRTDIRAEEEEDGKRVAPWENSGPVRGLFSPKFPLNTKEDQDEGKTQGRSRSLDGDQPTRQQRRRKRRSRSCGNTSTGSESEKMASNKDSRRRKKRQSPDILMWQHIQKQLVEPHSHLDRQTEEIPYVEVRLSGGEPIRARRSPRRSRHRQCTSASDLLSKTELVPPLPVTKTSDTLTEAPAI